VVNISLATLRTNGAVASVVGDDGNIVDLVRRNLERDPRKICGEASAYLRELADAFDLLSEMPDAFKEASQRKAERKAERRADSATAT
jgi:hypothetical protein